jgi:hypothetical protein
LSKHAVIRYRERVRPSITLAQAREDLDRLKAMGAVTSERPDWLRNTEQDGHAGYLLLGEDLVLILASDGGPDLTAVTCLVRGTISPRERRRREQGKQRHHKKNRARKRG